MTNFDYYIKSGRTEESWEEAWEDFLKFNKSVSDKEKTGRAIDKYNRWLLKEHEEPILDDAEKEYLSNVIKPFRDKVVYIVKKNDTEIAYHITVALKNSVYEGADYLVFPDFSYTSKMYKNMRIDRHYTLKDLGL